MVWSAYCGLPLSLEKVGTVLGLDKQSLVQAKILFAIFSDALHSTKTNGQRTRNLPEHDSEKWNLYKIYNKRDVETELEIQERLARFPMPKLEWANYHLDQWINDRGVLIDLELAKNAIQMNESLRVEAMERLQKLTGLENPNSVQQQDGFLNKV